MSDRSRSQIVGRWLVWGALVLAITPILAAEPAGKFPVLDRVAEHAARHPDGAAPNSWDRQAYEQLSPAALAQLPIGVFDSGIGGLTVLEAILAADSFHNDTWQPGADGRPDFAGERFVYLGDQANMPYGNYPARGKESFLRELILKDAVFLLGKRYHAPTADRFEVRLDKPPVKAIVIACNTATAYGLEDIRAAVHRWRLPIPVIGVVEAGARGLMRIPGGGGVGVLATTGTCASGVYPRTIAHTLGLAGQSLPVVSQWGSGQLAGVIEGDPAYPTPVSEQTAADVRALVAAHRDQIRAAGGEPIPLRKIVLGCTHFPLVTTELDAAFAALRADAEFAPWIAEKREFVNPAEWTARELVRELALAKLRAVPTSDTTGPSSQFFLSVANDDCDSARRSAPGVLDPDYKYGRDVGQLATEDTIVVPLTRERLPAVSRGLVRDKLPTVWQAIPRS